MAQEERGKRKRALADYSDAIRLNPQFADAYFHRARFAYDGYEWDDSKALADLDEVIRLDPKYTRAYYYRGLMREELFDDPEGALDDYQMYLDLGGGVEYEDQEEVEEWISELKRDQKFPWSILKRLR